METTVIFKKSFQFLPTNDPVMATNKTAEICLALHLHIQLTNKE